jgi:hypothetical protein
VKRIAHSIALTVLAGSYMLQMIDSVQAAERFKRLYAEEIRNRIVGNVVTDGSHWSDRFEPGGALDGMELGQRKPGTWRLQGSEMCVTRKARKPVEECFEIWQSSNEIEYRDNGVTLTSGVLRKE